MKQEKIKEINRLLDETEEREIARHGIVVEMGIFCKRTGKMLRKAEFNRIDLGPGVKPPDETRF